jgi:hypothetical protein
MKVIKMKNKEQFQQLLIEFSISLYPQHSLPNLQCNELIDEHFDSGFIVNKENKTVAMACVILNKNLIFKNQNAICLSHYECENDETTSALLLNSIVDYCKKIDYKYIIGPMNGSTWKNYRFATAPIKDSFFTETFHKEYYIEQFEKFGFEIAGNYHTQKGKVEHPEKTPTFSNKHIKFRKIDLDNYESELKQIYHFSSEVFKHNFLFTETNEDSFINKYRLIKPYLNPDFILIAEENNEMIGLILTLHDYFNTEEKRLIIKTICRKNGRKYLDVADELIYRIVETGKEQGYETMLHAFMFHNNASNRLSNHYKGNLFRLYKLFYKAL